MLKFDPDRPVVAPKAAATLLVVRPGMGIMGMGAAVILGAALCNALYQLVTRRLRTVDDPLTTLLYTALAGSVVLSAVVPFVWVVPVIEHWPLFALMGVLGGASHFTLIKAFQRAPAATVAPFSYVSLLWAVAIGFVLFGDLPDLWTLVGAVIIASGGMYILHRERVRRRAHIEQ